ncbi:MAG: putative site-specific integrase-resolvase [Rhodobacteraceae bacterium HLUCCA12]|nr:MAG: putative site-specific integrase-resolvase [Rhodobacteraceae bacterium HLUCCA12]
MNAPEYRPPPHDANADPLLSDWMDRQELAETLGISVETLRRWQAQGIGPPLAKLGRRVLYRREAVRQWMVTREMGWGESQ